MCTSLSVQPFNIPKGGRQVSTYWKMILSSNSFIILLERFRFELSSSRNNLESLCFEKVQTLAISLIPNLFLSV